VHKGAVNGRCEGGKTSTTETGNLTVCCLFVLFIDRYGAHAAYHCLRLQGYIEAVSLRLVRPVPR
jgi:hypothetical protein